MAQIEYQSTAIKLSYLDEEKDEILLMDQDDYVGALDLAYKFFNNVLKIEIKPAPNSKIMVKEEPDEFIVTKRCKGKGKKKGPVKKGKKKLSEDNSSSENEEKEIGKALKFLI